MPQADPTELAALFDAHAPYVFRVLRRFGVRDADVDDVLQEVFLVVMRRYADFEGRSKVRTWLYAICRGCASNYRQRAVHRREELRAESPEMTAASCPAEALAGQQALERLDASLDRLPDAQRQVYVLYELEEIPMAEVAEIVDCPVNTAYARLRAARASVRAAFARADRSVA
jgi:RNA polymerase sigma-70 factor (ECF subfamily)